MDIPLEEFNILFLDDEETITKMAETIFGNDFNIISANTSKEAFSILENNKIGIVISDFNMPDINGVEFLTQVMSNSPMIKRVLISGKMDMDIVYDSINKASINLLIEKPWNYQEFKDNLTDLMRSFIDEYNESLRVRELETKEFPPVSESYRHTDDLLDILSSLKESRKISEFATHFLSVLEGVQSLTLVNIEFYLDTKDEVILSHAFQYLSDIEVIANHMTKRVSAYTYFY